MKKLTIALVLVLVASLAFGAVVLADGSWDFEDPCVADNKDFAWAKGYDNDSEEETYYGDKSPNPNKLNDYYNAYQDEGSGEGWLDKIFVKWGSHHSIYLGEDAFYFALEPSGTNNPPLPPSEDPFYNAGQFDVILCSTAYYQSYHWEGGYLDGKILRDDLSQVGKSNGDYYRLDIPAGTEITSFGNRVWGLKMKVDFYGQYITFNPKNIQFSNVCSVSKLVGEEWIEVVSFVEIVDGTAIQVDLSVPASIYPSSYTIANNVVKSG